VNRDSREDTDWRGVLVAVIAIPLIAFGAFIGGTALFHDCGEVQSWPNFQIFLAASDLRESAVAAGGSFPEDGEEVQRRLASIGERGLDPWGRAYGYERLGDDGKRARVFTLGADDAPGGEDCDEDIVWWADLEDEYWTQDVREPPRAWRTGEGPAPGESAGSR
jgi:hypothetical protein